jgi:hypothetical protein
MPFLSEKQRRYLFKFHPDIAKRWTREGSANSYGSKPRPKKLKRKKGPHD